MTRAYQMTGNDRRGFHSATLAPLAQVHDGNEAFTQQQLTVHGKLDGLAGNQGVGLPVGGTGARPVRRVKVFDRNAALGGGDAHVRTRKRARLILHGDRGVRGTLRRGRAAEHDRAVDGD